MVFSVTIYTKHNKKHSSDNTYIVSMGLKNDDHDPIEKTIRRRIKQHQ